MISSRFATVLASRDGFLVARRWRRYSENVGTSALTSAPLKTPNRIVGIVAAARKVSISHCVPKNFALTTSRKKPNSVEPKVAAMTKRVDVAIVRCVGGRIDDAESGPNARPRRGSRRGSCAR